MRYHPGVSFASFPDQQRAITLLQRSLTKGRLAHAYLFSGPRIAELESMAATLAKALNCLEWRDGTVGSDSCDRCLSCRKIDLVNHPDVHWLRPESKLRLIKSDETRELMNSIHLKPTEARYKVAVVSGVDRFHPNAANAFLKTLEEPPARSVLLLLSTEHQRILETIVSRCLRLELSSTGMRGIDTSSISWLKDFATMASGPNHGLLDRYRLLGVLLRKLAEMKESVEEDTSSKSPLERYDDLDPDLRERLDQESTAAAEGEYRRQRTELLAGLHWWLRDVWLQSLTPATDLLSLPELANSTRLVARRLTPARARMNLPLMDQLQRSLQTNVQEPLALEVGISKLEL